jgi:hypothetical protein
MGRDQFLNRGKIFGVIGGDVEETIRRECSMNRGDERIRNRAAALMSAFRPGIGKQQVHDPNACWRYEVREGVSCVDVQNPRIRQLKSGSFATKTANTPRQPFDAEKIAVGMTRGQGCEKRAVTAANIDFHGSAAPEQRSEIQRL